MRLPACTLRDAVCILVAATLSFRALEVAWNNNVDLLPWSSETFSVALIAAFMAVAYFAFLRRGAGPALAAVACAGVGIAQSFNCAFKGVAILPSDLLALGTAAAVSAGYDYVLTPAMLDALGLLCMALAILSLIRPPKLPVGGNMSTEASSVDMPKDPQGGQQRPRRFFDYGRCASFAQNDNRFPYQPRRVSLLQYGDGGAHRTR